MKKVLILTISLFFSASACVFAQNQENQMQKSMSEIASEQADKLGTELGLEHWQIFYVDSILCHNLGEMEKKIRAMGEAKVTGQDIYQSVQDEWNAKTDEAFRKLFTDEQWKKYLRTGALKEMKARERRQMQQKKADEALRKLREKGEL